MLDDVNSQLDEPEKKGGILPPYCLLTDSGSCILVNLEEWADVYTKNADEENATGTASRDPEVFIPAAQRAAHIFDGAKEAMDEVSQTQPCDHCPRRRL